jgi:hypothetical protein
LNPPVGLAGGFSVFELQTLLRFAHFTDGDERQYGKEG